VIANQSFERSAPPPLAPFRRLRRNAGAGRPRISHIDLRSIPRSVRRPRLSPALANCLLCASLWLSLLLAIWAGRGWIGLLFSGQLLSAGASVFQKLAQKTQYAFGQCSAAPAPWEGRLHG